MLNNILSRCNFSVTFIKSTYPKFSPLWATKTVHLKIVIFCKKVIRKEMKRERKREREDAVCDKSLTQFFPQSTTKIYLCLKERALIQFNKNFLWVKSRDLNRFIPHSKYFSQFALGFWQANEIPMSTSVFQSHKMFSGFWTKSFMNWKHKWPRVNLLFWNAKELPKS